MRRRGVSSLLLCLLAVILLFLWGVAQQFVTTTTRRRVHRANLVRTAVIQALSASHQGVAWLEVQANETLDPDRPGGGPSIAETLRDLQAGDTVEFPYRPPWLTGDARVVLQDARGIAHVHEVVEGQGTKPDEVACERLVELEARRRLGELTEEEQREWSERMGGYLPGEVHGVVDLQATSRIRWDRRPIDVRATTRYAFWLELSPCPEAYAEDPGKGWGSSFRSNPVELGRWVEITPFRDDAEDEGEP